MRQQLAGYLKRALDVPDGAGAALFGQRDGGGLEAFGYVAGAVYPQEEERDATHGLRGNAAELVDHRAVRLVPVQESLDQRGCMIERAAHFCQIGWNGMTGGPGGGVFAVWLSRVMLLSVGGVLIRSLGQTQTSEQGNVFAYVERPLSETFIAIAALFFVLPLVKYLHKGGPRSVAPAE